MTDIETLKSYLYSVRIITSNNCWIHPFKFRRGYSQTLFRNKLYNVSRLSAFMYHNLDLNNKKQEACHKNICFSKRCWNPDHIYVGTHQNNMEDSLKEGTHISLINKGKTFCKNGHEFTKENTYIRPNGNRTCKECNRIIVAKKRGNR